MMNPKRKSNIFLHCVIICLICLPVTFKTVLADSHENTIADENSLEGFEEEGEGADDLIPDVNEIDVSDIRIASTTDSFYSYNGFVRQEISYSFQRDEPDFSKIKSSLNLTLDLNIFEGWRAKLNWNGFFDYAYTYLGRDNFSEDTLNTYEHEGEVRELFVDGPIGDFVRIKVGRQIIAWGESESAQITDMANPRDLREPGMVDVEDSRLPVTSTKLSFSLDPFEINLVAIHEIRPSKQPGAGSEFDFLKELRSSQMIRVKDDNIPASNRENFEYLFRLFSPFHGGDFSFIAADLFSDTPYLDLNEVVFTTSSSPGPESISLEPRYKRVKAFGVSGNMVSGVWLFKGEVARKLNKAVPLKMEEIKKIIRQLAMSARPSLLSGTPVVTFSEDDITEKSWREKNTLQLMFGVEYSGFSDISMSVEIAGEKIEDYEEVLSDEELGGSLMFMFSQSAYNDQLKSRIIWIRFSGNNGDVIRLSSDYDLMDALTLSGGGIFYLAPNEEATYYNFRENDRVILGLKYSF